MASRRNFLKNAALASGMVGFPGMAAPQDAHPNKQKSIVCTGGHPDDPESMAGGTLAKLAALGHKVTILYLTTGEAGIPGTSNQDAASIRKNEAIEACKILKCTPLFAGQVDGDTVFNNEWVGKLKSMLDRLRPDIVLTHWPIDSHKDHQVASLLTMQVWMASQKKFELYFGEVCSGEQTMTFHPTDYIDITEQQETKRQAVYCHKSQDPAGIYACGHTSAEDFRGRELGVKAAEAFVRIKGSTMGSLF